LLGGIGAAFWQTRRAKRLPCSAAYESSKKIRQRQFQQIYGQF